MKITRMNGNLLDVTHGHIVHGCNAQGVMGSGVALSVKKKWPEAFYTYKTDLDHDKEANRPSLGRVFPYKVNDDLIVWNAITQENFGSKSRNVSYDAIETCFRIIDFRINNDHPGTEGVKKEIHIPLIGAGLGGGNWEIIREIIEQTVTTPTTLWIYQP